MSVRASEKLEAEEKYDTNKVVLGLKGNPNCLKRVLHVQNKSMIFYFLY